VGLSSGASCDQARCRAAVTETPLHFLGVKWSSIVQLGDDGTAGAKGNDSAETLPSTPGEGAERVNWPWDYCYIRRIIPAQEAVQPLAQSKCALVKLKRRSYVFVAGRSASVCFPIACCLRRSSPSFSRRSFSVGSTRPYRARHTASSSFQGNGALTVVRGVSAVSKRLNARRTISRCISGCQG
jgi:hypothetical protein